MTQIEFYKSFQFVAELLIAELMFIIPFHRRRYFVLRLIVSLAAVVAFGYFFPVVDGGAIYMSFMFCMIFMVTIFTFKFMFRQSWLTIVFCCVAGYTTQHLTYEIYNIELNVISNISAAGGGLGNLGQYGSGEILLFSNLFIVAVYVSTYVLSYMCCYMIFATRLKSGEDIQLKKTFIFVFAMLILVVDIILNAVVVYYIDGGMLIYTVIVGLYNVICCITALFLLFEVTKTNHLENTLDIVQRLWHEAKKQYEESKENIELINMKCHDLKHQIHSLGNKGDVSPRVIDEIEKRISIYDSAIKTGNAALDVILTEKSLLCNMRGIKFSCIIDGEELSFMAEEDIYSVFGNIVDNAIEAVLECDEDKRVINLYVKRVGGMLLVRGSNYYSTPFVMENGIPQTTKPDKRYHGYGIQSISYVCARYGGEVTISAEEGVFSITILFCDAGLISADRE